MSPQICGRGHELTHSNIYRTKDGKERCKACYFAYFYTDHCRHREIIPIEWCGYQTRIKNTGLVLRERHA